MKAAVRKAEWKHFPCFAHTLNLIVRESLKHIQGTVTKVKSVVEYVNRSTVATERLKATQKQMGLEKEAIIATIALVNPSLPTLTLDEWDMIKDVCEILKPFEEVTVEISGERFVTASKVILIARDLQKVVQRLRGAVFKHAPVLSMMCSLAEEMQNRFHNIEQVRLLSEATLLDPRFKQRAFRDPAAADEAAKSITAAAARVWSSDEQTQAERTTLPAPPPPSEPTSSVWEDFDERAADAVSISNPSSAAVTAMRGYLAETLIPRTENPLAWWKARQAVYEGLTAVMKRRLVATSVPSEIIFSKTGQIISDRRSRLSPNKVRQIAFLNANLP
ncbi:hypothetical protein R3I93_002511 [Phoxinus phoxinus]|uniref:HAT C-terminal dimerisation domain-containing protein n=1 Tax=Phoxinus phoxinus TaxID=58324 RepID=A0AAN9DRY0_9TELE